MCICKCVYVHTFADDALRMVASPEQDDSGDVATVTECTASLRGAATSVELNLTTSVTLEAECNGMQQGRITIDSRWDHFHSTARISP